MASATVAVADDAAKAPRELLDCALSRCGFDRIAAARGASRALILLDLCGFELDSAALPSRELVEQLLDRLAALGWQDIGIALTADSSSTFADNRSAAALADLFGYEYRTASGTAYDVLDLSEDLIEADFPPGSVLNGALLSRAWVECGLRIVLAKAATDIPEGIVLSANALFAALPLHDKDYYYRLTLDPVDVVSLLLERCPIGVALVDGIGAPDGSGGRAIPRASASAFIVVGTDILAVDCIAAGKLGADPAISPLLRGLLQRRGWPAFKEMNGPLQAVPGFRLPDPWLLESARWRDSSAYLARLVAPWLRRVDTSLFPFKKPLDAMINAQLRARIADPDADTAGRAWLIYANTLCATLQRSLDAWRVNYSKDHVERRLAGVSTETLTRDDVDYVLMQRELDDLQHWLGAPDEYLLQPTLHWRELGGATIFSCRRRFPVPFGTFTAHVDVARSIQYMNDYLGGKILVLERDAAGRSLRQVERNLYLPQPNYLAWWGALPIDVSKIESVIYRAEYHRMYWKTIKSENASASFDDGIIEFRGEGAETLVTVFGRQLFALPPTLDRAALDRAPQLKAQLIEHAYRQFFSRTFSNLEALCEGRDILIGRAVALPKEPGEVPARPIDSLGAIVAQVLEVLGPWLQRLVGQSPERRARPSIATDGLGYAHFQAATVPAPTAATPDPLVAWAGDFWSGYLEALSRDVLRMGRHA
jgi:Domain of unknown function (DUF362)